MYDDQSQRVQLRREGIELTAPAGKKITLKIGDDTTVTVTKDKIKGTIGTSNGPTFLLVRGKCAQIKGNLLHFTVDIGNGRLMQSSVPVIGADPYAGE